MRRIITFLVFLAALTLSQLARPQAKDMSNDERHQVDSMLFQVASDVSKHYYDPKLHGIDWQAKVKEAREQIKQEKSFNMAMAHVAAALDSLNDSHTFLIPPRRPYILDHGWILEMVGDKCLVTHVRPGGDAETHGVKPGDQVLAINGYRVGRDNLWKIEFAFNALRPLPQLTIALRDPQGVDRKVLLQAQFRQRAHVQDLDPNTIMRMELDEEQWAREQAIRTVGYGDKLLVAKLPSFMLGEVETNEFMSQVERHEALILDLRENPGGGIDALKRVASSLFNHDVKMFDRVGRDSTKTVVAKPNRHPFQGKLFVLTDSKSASASELLARIVQLEKRGVVIGDRSAGKVMESRVYSYSAGIDVVTFYGASITDANLLMSDGESLEHRGVTPDDAVLQTADDLANGRDPALAYAAELAGVKITADQAGKLFPYEWPKEF